MTEDTRYPYTYSCDYIRGLVLGDFQRTPILSRSQASKIRQGIAAALGIDDEILASKLADYDLLCRTQPTPQTIPQT